ncbi:MAG: hypothetical protein K1W33_00490 [Clostridia bacterium]|nr:hypothetical protein [Clostridia bacterium]
MNKFVKDHIKKIVEVIVLLVILLILGKIFFSYNLNMTWDSSEYIGLASFIGTDQMQSNWIGHRGVGFPWLIHLSQSLSDIKVDGFLKLMFSFYVCMILSIYLIYRKLKKEGFLQNKILILAFIGYIGIFIALNPMFFGYYHTALTEFVGITGIAVMSVLSWWWADFTWEKNKLGIIIYPIIFSATTILLYHVKQSFVVLALLPILTASILSVFNNFNYKNVISKILTLSFVGLSLLHSVKLWGFFMSYTEAGSKYYLKLILIAIAVLLATVFIGFAINLFQKRKKKKMANISKAIIAILLVIVCMIVFNHYDLNDEYGKYIPEEEIAIDETEVTQQVETSKEAKGIDVLKATTAARIDNRIIIGVLGDRIATTYNFEELATDEKDVITIGENFQVETLPPTIDRDLISIEDNIKIDKILDGKIKDIYFNIYNNEANDKYFVYFYDKSNSFKNQLDFFIKICLNYPSQVFKIYKQNYWKIIFVQEGDFSPYERENFNIPSKIYIPGTDNLVDVNKDYEQYIEEYRSVMEENLISGKLNNYMNKNIHRIITIMEIALWQAPLMLCISIVAYLYFRIFNNTEENKGKISLLQFIIILFATTYGGIMSYVVFGSSVDRYVIPMTLTAFVAYFLVGLLVLEFIVHLVKKINLEKSKKTATKRQTIKKSSI